MKIHIDLVHPADVNFYKYALNRLRDKGFEVLLTVMNRGKLPLIVSNELGEATIIGTHAKGVSLSAKSNSVIRRAWALRQFINTFKPDITTSFSFYPALATYSNKSIQSVVFHDDPEYKLQFKFCKLFADKLIVPWFVEEDARNIFPRRFLKEWAYLSPDVFQANSSILDMYDLQPFEYIFLRDVANISMNYKKQAPIDYQQIINFLLEHNIRTLVSLEDKSKISQFKGATILKEPVRDIHSIIYHAKVVLSSGDTMVREAALLGVPALYLGDRDMLANQIFEKLGLIKRWENQEYFETYVEGITPERNTHKLDSLALEPTTEMIVNELLENKTTLTV